MRILVVTAVAAERDAVAGALGGPPARIPLASYVLHRVTSGAVTFDLLAAGVGPAA
ncbi:futalosine hydrolase, partial [Streptomyces kunmingensis]|nr:futalosine hydrolase [Streptomyces kunmingensis]